MIALGYKSKLEATMGHAILQSDVSSSATCINSYTVLGNSRYTKTSVQNITYQKKKKKKKNSEYDLP